MKIITFWFSLLILVAPPSTAPTSQPIKSRTVSEMLREVDKKFMPKNGEWSIPQQARANKILKTNVGKKVVVEFNLGNIGASWVDARVKQVRINGYSLFQIIQVQIDKSNEDKLLDVKSGDKVRIEGELTDISIGNFRITDGNTGINLKLKNGIFIK